MSGDDWQVGDLALCVAPQWDTLGIWSPVVGGVYMVSACGDDGFGPWLDFAEDPDLCDESAFDACAFRKIRPLTDEERDSFTAELRNDQRTPVEA